MRYILFNRWRLFDQVWIVTVWHLCELFDFFYLLLWLLFCLTEQSLFWQFWGRPSRGSVVLNYFEFGPAAQEEMWLKDITI